MDTPFANVYHYLYNVSFRIVLLNYNFNSIFDKWSISNVDYNRCHHYNNSAKMYILISSNRPFMINNLLSSINFSTMKSNITYTVT